MKQRLIIGGLAAVVTLGVLAVPQQRQKRSYRRPSSRMLLGMPTNMAYLSTRLRGA
jgi:hypothetical protein